MFTKCIKLLSAEGRVQAELSPAVTFLSSPVWFEESTVNSSYYPSSKHQVSGGPSLWSRLPRRLRQEEFYLSRNSALKGTMNETAK